jgi:hypothetical protein
VAALYSLEQRWRLLVPEGAVIMRVSSRRETVALMRTLPAETVIALVGGRRLRRVARRGRLTVRKEYVALPSLATPVVIAETGAQPLGWTARSVLTVPSGVTRLHAPLWVAIRLMKAMPGLLTRAPMGDRLLIGVKP